MRPRRAVVAVALAMTAVALAGCAPTVSLDPGADANDPGCAEIAVRLPDSVAGQPRRETDAQATAAWGSPAAVLLRCGVAVPGPTTLPCVDADGVDWILDESKAPETIRYITFGRDPATAVILDHTKVSDSSVLADLKEAIEAVPATKKCRSLADTGS